MKPLSILVTFWLCPLLAFSQGGSKAKLSGRILDSDSKRPLFGVSVVLVRTKDSSRTPYSSISDEQGRYLLTGVEAGNYRLFMSCIGYRRLLSDSILKVGQDSLKVADQLLVRNALELAQVEIIESRLPVSLKRDTTEFNAGYYKTKEGSPVSELFKKLPGVEISPDGSITINGNPVKQILIDGKPYFGNDLKMAASNILAGMIDKIQLIDRKTPSEDRGTTLNQTYEKAINIALKKDQYNQLNGLLTAGYGSDQRYSSRTTLNHFSQRQQLSIIGSVNNVANFEENMSTIGGNGNTVVWNTGINFNQDLSPKLTLLTSYMASGDNSTIINKSTRQTFLKDSSLFYQQNSTNQASATFHAAEISLKYLIDSSSSLYVINRINYNSKSNLQENDFTTQASDTRMINRGASDNTTATHSLFYLTNWTYTKNFSQPGQSLIAGFNYSHGNALQKNFYRTNTAFNQTNGEQILDSLNQFNRQKDASLIIQLTANYSQPLYRDHFLDVAYVYSRFGNTTDKSVYVPGRMKDFYDVRVDSLSTDFSSMTTAQFSTFSFRAQKQQYDYAIGVGVIQNILSSKDLSRLTSFKKNLLNFFPTATFNYTPNKTLRLHFDYSRNVMPPAADQLQPVPDNSNPLYLRLGNPELKPTTQDYFNFNLRSFNPTQVLSYTFNGSLALSQNQIVYNTFMDSLGRQTAIPANISGGYYASFYLSTSLRLKAIKSAINSNTSLNMSRDFSFTNAVLNQTRKTSLRQAFSFNYTPGDLFDVMTNLATVYNKVHYSLQKSDYKYFDYTIDLSGTVNLPASIAISTKLNYALSSGRQQGYNNDMLILNAEVSKSLLPGRRGQLKLQVFDLLDRNNSRQRSVGDTYIEDSATNPLTRFILLSFTYYLKK